MQNGARTEQVAGITRTIQRNSVQEVSGGNFARISDDGYTITKYKSSDWLRKGDRIAKTTVESRPIDDVIYGTMQIKSVSGLTTPIGGLSVGEKIGVASLGATSGYGGVHVLINQREREQKQKEDLIKQIIQNPNGDNP
jgi:hypothetical protein